MAHIELNDHAPGIIGLFRYRPETAGPLLELTEALLRNDSPLSRGERELIATYVSRKNECTFCSTAHGQLAAKQLDGGQALVDAVCGDTDDADISDKLRALLAIAGAVQQGGRAVTEKTVAVARDAGATDLEIHDTVLIAAAFCMFNRYVDGLGTTAPPNADDYHPMTDQMVRNGYLSLESPDGRSQVDD